MKNKLIKGKRISRRGMLPMLGSTLFIPFLGFGNSSNDTEVYSEKDNEYQTLLKSDGTVVKVKTAILKKSKVVQKGMSNKSLLNWLRKKRTL